MLQEKLGDPYLIHYACIRLLEHFSVSTEHQLWNPVFCTQPTANHDELLADGIQQRYFNHNFECILDSDRVLIRPQAFVEPLYFAGLHAPTETFVALEAKDRAMKETVAKQKKTAKKKEKKSVSHESILRPHFHRLYGLALAEYEEHAKKPISILSTTHFDFNDTKLVKGLDVSYYMNDKKKQCILLGPFRTDNPMHRVAMGRVLYRSRKMTEWYRDYFETDYIRLEFPVVTLMRSKSNESKESKEDHEIYLHHQYAFRRYRLRGTKQSECTGESTLIVQLFRCLLGIAENSQERLAHTLNHTNFSSVFLMMKMRTCTSYETERTYRMQEQHRFKAKSKLDRLPAQHTFLFGHRTKGTMHDTIQNWCLTMHDLPVKGTVVSFLNDLGGDLDFKKSPELVQLVLKTLF
jgi:hypothetical protein